MYMEEMELPKKRSQKKKTENKKLYIIGKTTGWSI